MPLKRSDIPRPVRPAETVECAALGGEVIVRGLLLSERLEMAVSDGPRMTRIPWMLALCVVDEDDKAVFDAAEWEAFGAQHVQACMDLFGVAQRLSGLDKDDAEGK